MLLALWIYATVEGVGSARRLDRLCQEHDAYRWLCGGVEECLKEAETQVKQLTEEREHPDPKINLKEQAARERAAKEREERIQAALRQLPVIQASKERQKWNLNKVRRKKITEPRTSTTDSEARVMKMPDGGYRPACNVQFATDVESGIISGAGVTNQGQDAGQGEVMEDQVAQRSGIHPGGI